MKRLKFLKPIVLVAVLFVMAAVTMSLTDYQSWSCFKRNVSIMKGSAAKPNDSLMLEIGAALDTNKMGVRLGPITQDTGRAYKVKGSVVWERTNNTYYSYNGTKWISMGIPSGVLFLGIENGTSDTSQKYLKMTVAGTNYYFRGFTVKP